MDESGKHLMDDKKMVVVFKGVGKHYHLGKQVLPVLEGLNLTIPQGIIYSLLGPSGCGKTTLLKCVIGRTAINEGILRVFGHNPRSKKSKLPGPQVGYMPQVIALTDFLTVTETLKLFGKIFGMDDKSIAKKSEQLLDVLEMSSHRKKLIKKLSVGQQRRISFAVALLNDSPLLILDEPTVGVDPVLRQSIWNYLTSLVKRTNSTVIITTHYIEEATKSHMVGLLLYGQLLAEGTPQALIAQHECPTLEDVFLKLCLTKLNNDGSITNSDENDAEAGTSQSNGLNGHRRIHKQDPTETTFSSGQKKCKCGNVIVKIKKKFRGRFFEKIKPTRLMALAEKSVKDIFRFPVGIVALLVLPALSMLIFPITIGNKLKNIPVGIINHDYDGIGNDYINSLDTEAINKVYYDDYNLAVNDAKLGKLMGILLLKENFTDSLIERFAHGILAHNESFVNGNIFMSLDYTNQPIAVSIHFEVLLALQKFVQVVLERTGLNPQLGNIPLQQLEGVFGEVSWNFQTFVAPTFLLILSSLFVMAATAILTVKKRDEGHFDRLYSSGVTSIELILSESMAQMVLMIPQLGLVLFVMFVINGFYNYGSFILVILLTILQYMCGLSIGFFVIGVCPDLLTSMAVLVSIFLTCVLSQGLFWPLDGMPVAFRYICQMGFFALPGEAMRNIMNRGWGLEHSSVLLGFSVLIIWTIIFFFFGWVAYRLRS
ncbi:hypothetical protein CHUAL_006355 [Chamberlinius hualienensis]